MILSIDTLELTLKAANIMMEALYLVNHLASNVSLWATSQHIYLRFLKLANFYLWFLMWSVSEFVASWCCHFSFILACFLAHRTM